MHLSPLAAIYLLQYALRSLCIQENSQWVYAIFWRILPRYYPPPKWEGQGAYDRSKGNRRNWILAWEDGFCKFAASSTPEINSGSCPTSSAHGNSELQPYQWEQPELFFKMSHEIYNYGEGLIGKVAADHGHKWIYKEPNDQGINFLSAWQNLADSYPRTWEAQFQSGIKTIALIAVEEGVIQLGGVHKVIEDLNYVVLLRKRFSYIESIPGVLLPHSSSSAYPSKVEGYGTLKNLHFQGSVAPQAELHDHFNQAIKITPSVSNLEAILSKLPSVVPQPSPPPMQPHLLPFQRHLKFMGFQNVVTKQELEDVVYRPELDVGESSNSMLKYYHQHQDYNV
ncbi:protein RICE SALT SENSITIVE 3-like [Abrus precatorius]|uniref:Protein RICE SALT SENSITIVE 3-like n=1 Tax=Abrus precatorius TaxID=3816 RepID=A0A8B8KW86_ABRPR|nr:protein RICE SALT SENSITIVE 3-like [Abrus precatorius]